MQIGYQLEFDPGGTIISANDNFIDIMKFDSETELIGKHHDMIAEEKDITSKAYIKFWKT